MQASQRTATEIPRAISSLVFGSSAPSASAACASEEKAFIPSGAPPRRFLNSELSVRVNTGPFVVPIVVVSCWIERRGSLQLYEKAAPDLIAKRLKIIAAGQNPVKDVWIRLRPTKAVSNSHTGT